MKNDKWSRRPRLNLLRSLPVYLSSQQPKYLLKRFFAFCLVGAFFSVVAPVIADESSTPLNSGLETSTATSEPTTSTSPSPSPEATEPPIPIDPAQTSPSPSPSSSHSALTTGSTQDSITASDSPSITPVAALKNQNMRVEVPSILPVDPRATSRNLPAVLLSGPRYLLACIEGNNLNFDIYEKNSVQTIFNNEQLVSGDKSSQLLISGTTEQVQAVLNSYGGLRAVTNRSAIAGLHATLSFTAINEPSLDPAFCLERSPANFRSIHFRPLGLGMNLIKNDLTLKK